MPHQDANVFLEFFRERSEFCFLHLWGLLFGLDIGFPLDLQNPLETPFAASEAVFAISAILQVIVKALFLFLASRGEEHVGEVRVSESEADAVIMNHILSLAGRIAGLLGL